MTVHRTLLYVPADRIDTYWASAVASGVDAVILDLEDAVAPSAKELARIALRRHLATRPAGPEMLVRVNSGDLLAADLADLAEHPDLTIMLPKADVSALDALDTLTAAAPRPVVALLETAAGIADLARLARHPSVVRLAMGEADLRADLGLGADAEHALWPIRMQVVIASRVGDLLPPVAPASTDWRDLDALRMSSARLRDAGFGGRTAIHPAQVATIGEVFRPSEADVAAARRLVERYEAAVATGSGVCTDDDGRMIDEAVVRSARRLLD